MVVVQHLAPFSCRLRSPTLSLWRIRVVPVGIPRTDPPVAPVDEQLRALFSRDFPRSIDRRLLGRMHRGRALRTGAPHGPAVLVSNDVLITFCHDIHLLA